MTPGKHLNGVIRLIGIAALLIGGNVFSSCTAPADDIAPNETARVFPAQDACKYPANATAKIFHPLGSGTWSAISLTDKRAGYRCSGSVGVVNFYTTPESPISVEYLADGTEQGSTIITIKYSAINAAENEPTFRTVFVNFANNTLQQAFGEPMPELMRRKILNLGSYFKTGKVEEEPFFIGEGFVNLTREHDPSARAIGVTLRVFPDKALKLK